MVDPPGDRLLKWHLAGSIPIDDRGIVETLVEEFGHPSVADWIYGRWQNFQTIIADPVARVRDGVQLVFAETPEAFASHLRALDFFHWSYGLGVLAPLVFLAPLAFLHRSSRALTVAIIGSILVWGALIFEAGGAITHQGSFFPQMAVIAMAAFALGQLDNRLAFGVAGLQVASVMAVYIIFN